MLASRVLRAINPTSGLTEALKVAVDLDADIKIAGQLRRFKLELIAAVPDIASAARDVELRRGNLGRASRRCGVADVLVCEGLRRHGAGVAIWNTLLGVESPALLVATIS